MGHAAACQAGSSTLHATSAHAAHLNGQRGRLRRRKHLVDAVRLRLPCQPAHAAKEGRRTHANPTGAPLQNPLLCTSPGSPMLYALAEHQRPQPQRHRRAARAGQGPEGSLAAPPSAAQSLVAGLPGHDVNQVVQRHALAALYVAAGAHDHGLVLAARLVRQRLVHRDGQLRGGVKAAGSEPRMHIDKCAILHTACWSVITRPRPLWLRCMLIEAKCCAPLWRRSVMHACEVDACM